MLKLQYFGHLMPRANSLEKTLMLGKIEGKRKRGQQRMRWWDGTINSVGMHLGKLQKRLWCWKDWRQEEKGATEDEMGGWHHQLKGHEFEQTPGDGKGQGSLVCCRPRACEESGVTQWLNNSSSLCTRLIKFLGKKKSGKPLCSGPSRFLEHLIATNK